MSSNRQRDGWYPEQKRRHFLQALGMGGVIATAGCSASDEAEDDEDIDDDDDDDTQADDTDDDVEPDPHFLLADLELSQTEVGVGDSLDVSVEVMNNGGDGTEEVSVLIADETVAATDVWLHGDDTASETFEGVRTDQFLSGEATLTVTSQSDELTATFTATPEVRTLADDGGWNWNERPHTVEDDGTLFYSYMDTAGNLTVSSHEASTGETATSVLFETDADLHEAMALNILDDGRIFVPIGGTWDKGQELWWRVSDAPGDISSFSDMHTSDVPDMEMGRFEDPMVHEDGTLYHGCYGRDGHRYAGLGISSDGGESFDDFIRLFAPSYGLSADRAYSAAFLDGDDIHFVTGHVGWSEQPGGYNIGGCYQVLYVCYSIEDNAFIDASGAGIGTADEPLTDVTDFDLVWDWEAEGNSEHRAMFSDIVVSDGTPYITFGVQDLVEAGTTSLFDGYWATPDENGSWQLRNVTQLGRGFDNTPERKCAEIQLDPRDPTAVIVVETNPAADTWILSRYATEDGGESWESEELYSSEERLAAPSIPRTVGERRRRAEVTWLEGHYAEWTEYNCEIKGLFAPF